MERVCHRLLWWFPIPQIFGISWWSVIQMQLCLGFQSHPKSVRCKNSKDRWKFGISMYGVRKPADIMTGDGYVSFVGKVTRLFIRK